MEEIMIRMIQYGRKYLNVDFVVLIRIKMEGIICWDDWGRRREEEEVGGMGGYMGSYVYVLLYYILLW